MRKLIIILTIGLYACSTGLEFPEGKEVIVIEGWVTTEEKQHWVKISQTVGFQDINSEVAIENAMVSIFDESTSTTHVLTYSDNGIYKTESFQGVIGRVYSLQVILNNGDIINSSPQILYQAPNIDNIAFDSFLEPDPETGEDLEIFFPIVTTTDPSEGINYYRYKGYRNDELMNAPSEIELLNDRLLVSGELDHFIPSFRYELGDDARIDLLSLSKEAYEFLELLKLQTTSIGSSSGTAPATLMGNLSYESKNEIILGFFGTSDVKSASSIVQ